MISPGEDDPMASIGHGHDLLIISLADGILIIL